MYSLLYIWRRWPAVGLMRQRVLPPCQSHWRVLLSLHDYDCALVFCLREANSPELAFRKKYQMFTPEEACVSRGK